MLKNTMIGFSNSLLKVYWMLRYDDTIVIFLSKDELKREGIDFSFFKKGAEYAIEIRSLKDGSSFCIYQKLYEFEKAEEGENEP